MKKLLAIIFTFCMVLSLPVIAEEVDTESEEMEKGTRMNPYSFDDEIHIGKVYEKDRYIDITIQFNEILDSETLKELYHDDSYFQDKDCRAFKGIMTTGEAYTDDDSISYLLDTYIYTEDLKDYCYPVIYDYENGNSLYDIFSYLDYDIIIPYDPESLDGDAKYIEFEFFASKDDYEAHSMSAIWVEIPEY